MLRTKFTGSRNRLIQDSSLQCSDFLLQYSHLLFFSTCQTQLALPLSVFLPSHLAIFIWHDNAMLRKEHNIANALESNELGAQIEYPEYPSLACLRGNSWLVCRLAGRAAGHSLGKPAKVTSNMAGVCVHKFRLTVNERWLAVRLTM